MDVTFAANSQSVSLSIEFTGNTTSEEGEQSQLQKMDDQEPAQHNESPANEDTAHSNNQEQDNSDGQRNITSEHHEAQEHEEAQRNEKTERERDQNEETERKRDQNDDTERERSQHEETERGEAQNEETERERDQHEETQREEVQDKKAKREDDQDEEPQRRSDRQRSNAAIREYFKIKARIPTLREKVQGQKLKLHKRMESEGEVLELETYLDTRYADKVLVSHDSEARAMPRYTTIGVEDPSISFINDRVVLPQINGRKPDRHDRTKSAVAPKESSPKESSKDHEKHIYCRLPSVYGRANSVDLCRPGTRKHDH